MSTLWVKSGSKVAFYSCKIVQDSVFLRVQYKDVTLPYLSVVWWWSSCDSTGASIYNSEADGACDSGPSSSAVNTAAHSFQSPLVQEMSSLYFLRPNVCVTQRCNSTFCPHSFIYVFCVDLRTNSDYFPIQH
jgi:hypothetical protein